MNLVDMIIEALGARRKKMKQETERPADVTDQKRKAPPVPRKLGSDQLAISDRIRPALRVVRGLQSLDRVPQRRRFFPRIVESRSTDCAADIERLPQSECEAVQDRLDSPSSGLRPDKQQPRKPDCSLPKVPDTRAGKP